MSARSKGPAIEVRQLRKTYGGGVEAVAGIDFDVEPGEVFGLLGPNGAGKSTTIGMLTTTVAPTAGQARVAGGPDYHRHAARVNEQVGGPQIGGMHEFKRLLAMAPEQAAA